MHRIVIAARRDMVQLTTSLLTNPTGHAVVNLEFVRVSMLIALLTDLISCKSDFFGCTVNNTVSVCSCVVKIKG